MTNPTASGAGDPTPPVISSSAAAVDYFHDAAVDYEVKHYASEIRSFMTVRHARVLEFADRLGLADGARVLDAGCGPGFLVEAFASRGWRVEGLDGAAGMLRAAELRLAAAEPRYRATFTQGDIERLPYPDGSFDMVCSTGVIDYLETDETVLAEFFRVLRPGGHLILPITNSLSPANWLNDVLEPLKRQSWITGPFNAVWTRLGRTKIRPRHFDVRLHRPWEIRESLRRARFTLVDDAYFFMMPWPRPLDQLLRRPTVVISKQLEKYSTSWFRFTGEGYLTLSRRP